MNSLRTSLWFDTQAEEAAAFYCSVFDGTIHGVTHYPEGSDRAGTALTVDFEINGMRFTGLNGGDQFAFTEAISIEVPCHGQDEIDRYWDALLEGGGTEGPCGWLKDRYGLSWQVYDFDAMMRVLTGDPEGAARGMQAMYTMTKIDIGAIERAAAGA